MSSDAALFLIKSKFDIRHQLKICDIIKMAIGKGKSNSKLKFAKKSKKNVFQTPKGRAKILYLQNFLRIPSYHGNILNQIIKTLNIYHGNVIKYVLMQKSQRKMCFNHQKLGVKNFTCKFF